MNVQHLIGTLHKAHFCRTGGALNKTVMLRAQCLFFNTNKLYVVSRTATGARVNENVKHI